jgi:glucose/arabinose dehydrogenase
VGRRWQIGARFPFGASVALLLPFLVALVTPTRAATAFASDRFQAQWQQGEAILPNFWGPLATAKDGQLEPYAEGTAQAICAPGSGAGCGQIIMPHMRLVQYFDKARMEQTTPASSVTNGLLTVELLSGRVQIGDTQFEQRQPARVPVAGDPDNVFPTYADLQSVTAKVAQDNAPVTLLLRASGGPGQYAAGASDPQAAVSDYDTVTGHRVAKAFADFRAKAGVPAVGLAVTEPFWAEVKVAGMPRTVMVQGFERRVLTYTPTNPDPFKVEFGNIGQQYYTWRASTDTGTVTPPSATSTAAPASALPLPAAPAGFQIRSDLDFAQQDGPPIRAFFHPKTGVFHVLTNTGNLFQIDRVTGAKKLILGLRRDDPDNQIFYAADFAPDGTFYAVRVIQPPSQPGQSVIHTGEVLRVTDTNSDNTVDSVAVLNRIQYPGGNLRFNHEITALRVGPDGMLYIGAGSHTDHGELDGGVGEVPETSAIFRISATQANSPWELFADGVRNPFGMAFRADGKLFDADHGPQDDMPEELNYIQQGRHYGFPYRFGNNQKNPEPDAPAEPPGMTFTPPIPNIGPDDLNTDGLDSANPSYTFTPHAAPGGLAFYNAIGGGHLFPAAYRGDCFLAFYGNVERSGEVRGFSVVRLTLTEASPGMFRVSVHTFLMGLRRPTDLAIAPDGAMIVLESSAAATPTDQTIGYGRVLEITPA